MNGQAYNGFERKITVMLRKCIKKYTFRHFNIQNSSPTAMSKKRPFYSCSVAVIVFPGGETNHYFLQIHTKILFRNTMYYL